MSNKTSLQILVQDLTADELLEFESCLTESDSDETQAEIAVSGGALVAEIQAVAYTVLLTGLAVDYLASVIIRVRSKFEKCIIFDFRNNTLVVTRHKAGADMAGKCVIVGPGGEVSISDEKSHSEVLQALKSIATGD